ncbi:MAG: hypothetical protein JO126_06680 [Alphaproteobacteria bacterium]|nr:hypothetical protein [Alphaproteobacteria bacterium]MBV8549124.1 hypothetical protein [Alphaproteobacteria bacterium]
MLDNFLKNFTDPQTLSDKALSAWLEYKLALLQGASYTQDVIDSFSPCVLESVPASDYGVEASPAWRRFFLATLLADWASYESKVDRADVARLKYIMSSAYPYFKLWTCCMPNGEVTPVGYTAWYPIARFVFEALRKDPAQIDDRGTFLPLRGGIGKSPKHAYVFNISIVPPLRNTVCAQKMMHSLRAEGRRYRQANIAAIAVADEGCRLAQLAGLKKVGRVTVQGESESLFIKQAAG